MQLSIIISSDGRVIAATKLHPAKPGLGLSPSSDKHTLHQIGVPSHLEGQSLEAIIKQIEIEAGGDPRFKAAL